MKTIIVACGSGIATSTMISEGVKELLQKHGIEATIIQCNVTEIGGYADHADLIVTSLQLESSFQVPVVKAVSFLTGIGRLETEQEILRHLT